MTSIDETRRTIRDLLTARGLTGTSHKPDTLHPGAAWPVKRESVYLTVGGCAAETEWEVIVLLPVGSNGAPVAASDELEHGIVGDLHAAGFNVRSSGPSPQLSAEYTLPALGLRVSSVTT